MSNQALEKTFLEAYGNHNDAIFRFILFKIDNRERALDIVQETFMKTWLHMTSKGKIENTRAFLYTVAGNLIIDEYRRRERKDYHTDSLDTLNEAGFEPSVSEDEVEKIMDKLDGEQAMTMIKELPPLYSSVLYMKYSEEMSIPEMAKSLDVSENVVSVRINRAMKKLKEMTEEELKKFKTNA